MSNELGKLRQSAAVMTYGPGAIIDFRIPGTGAAVSVVASGLESWEEAAEQAGATEADFRKLNEPRLSAKLGVKYFRIPPVAPDTDSTASEQTLHLSGVRFPGWLQCPRCDEIRRARRWATKPGNPSRYCAACTADLPEEKKAYVVPVRFVVSCRNGHLDDFPWAWWIHWGGVCPQNNDRIFKLETLGAGLAGLLASCPKCGSSRSMEHIFSPNAFDDLGCSGARPWLSDADEHCELTPVTLQRGASNVYFPLMQSALVIPPWSEEIIRRLGYHWGSIVGIVDDEGRTASESRSAYIDLVWSEISDLCLGLEKASLKNIVEDKIREATSVQSGDLRWDEYQQLNSSRNRTGGVGDDFQLRRETLPSELGSLRSLIRVVSLREIRALEAFSRIEPVPGKPDKPPIARQMLSGGYLPWLPAIEVRGEGVFISLNAERLAEWEQQRVVQDRVRSLPYLESRVLNPDNLRTLEVSPQLGARFLLIHTLAHVLMRQLAIQCGYSSASLRERLFVGVGDREMAGLMIYTSTNDSDGTLGGLQRQGEADRFAPMFLEAIRANQWCSSDPICIKGLISATDSSSLAACHSCVLAPETSCEEHNRFLDRAMLVGIPECPSLGFFNDMLGMR